MKFGDLRGILQYVPQFRGRTFVVALDGDVVASANFSNILLDLAVLRSLNVKVVLAHGAAHQIEQLAKRRGASLGNYDGSGPTDDAGLEISLDAITRMTSEVMKSLTAVRIRAAIANAIIAHPAGIIGGLDLGHTGAVERVDTETLLGFLDRDIFPVVPPLGYDAGGRTFRVNSDEVAMKAGVGLNAAKIIFVASEEPDFGLGSQDAHQLDTERAKELRQSLGAGISPGFASKLRYAIRACQEGVPRVHLINGNREDAILAELFSNEGIGTMIFSDDYRTLRPAVPGDVDEMLLMMRRAVEDEKLVERTKADLLNALADFQVLEIDGNVVGCVAVHHYPEEKMAEVACLYIKQDHEGLGYGRRLTEAAEVRARKTGADEIFAFSTQAAGFFEKQKYKRADDFSRIPEGRRALAERSGRHSVVLFKSLTG